MISSLKNPLVKQLRQLHPAKGRREQGQFLLEGTHLIETACQGDCSLAVLCYTAAWRDRNGHLWEKVSRLADRTEEVSEAVLQHMATTVNPDGVIAIAKFFTAMPHRDRPLQLGLILERIQDPGNLGTLIRTAAAVDVDRLWLSADSVDPFHPKVLRASAGAWFQIPMTVSENLIEILQTYREQNIQIIATLPQAQQTYWDIDLTVPSLILLGNEGSGLSEELIARADTPIRIPLAAGVESLNVAIAGSLILYEARRQHQSKTARTARSKEDFAITD